MLVLPQPSEDSADSLKFAEPAFNAALRAPSLDRLALARELFHEAAAEGCKAINVKDPFVARYFGELLLRYVKSEAVEEPPGLRGNIDSLSARFDAAQLFKGEERCDAFRQVGDHALMQCSVFRERMEVLSGRSAHYCFDYYRSVGSEAYSNASQSVVFPQTARVTRLLADKFELFSGGLEYAVLSIGLPQEKRGIYVPRIIRDTNDL